MSVNVSYDDGQTYQSIGSTSDHSVTLEYVISDFTPPAILYFEVDDDAHTGGFLATVNITCSDGYSFQFYTTEKHTDWFPAVSSNFDDLDIDTFRVATNPPSCMNDDAYWIWNGRNTDDVVFELDLFQEWNSSQPTSDPTVSPTAEPSHGPTMSPSMAPTTDPTVDPSIDPTINPTG